MAPRAGAIATFALLLGASLRISPSGAATVTCISPAQTPMLFYSSPDMTAMLDGFACVTRPNPSADCGGRVCTSFSFAFNLTSLGSPFNVTGLWAYLPAFATSLPTSSLHDVVLTRAVSPGDAFAIQVTLRDSACDFLVDFKATTMRVDPSSFNGSASTAEFTFYVPAGTSPQSAAVQIIRDNSPPLPPKPPTPPSPAPPVPPR